jgi:hypothetical protein
VVFVTGCAASPSASGRRTISAAGIPFVPSPTSVIASTVLDLAGRDVIGCVYIYPLRDSDSDACALSRVRESHTHLDTPLWHAASEWLESDGPFASVEYAPRT